MHHNLFKEEINQGKGNNVMEKIKIFQVDAFTDTLFRGNPAAVCILDEWLKEEVMQSIGAENNLAETAFIVKRENGFDIRWFTPTVEVALCGHATLAAAHIIFHQLNYDKEEIIFNTQKSGILKVAKKGDVLVLDFPTDDYKKVDLFPEIEEAFQHSLEELYKGKSDYMVVLKNEDAVSNFLPDFRKLSKIETRGIIVTAPGNTVDFVSRFFTPQQGIDEDPVTGSAHTTLIPYWSKRLKKEELEARQISKRGGTLYCRHQGERVSIGGKSKLYLTGEIFVK